MLARKEERNRLIEMTNRYIYMDDNGILKLNMEQAKEELSHKDYMDFLYISDKALEYVNDYFRRSA